MLFEFKEIAHAAEDADIADIADIAVIRKFANQAMVVGVAERSPAALLCSFGEGGCVGDPAQQSAKIRP
jgi:hypothetical protein